MEMGDYAAKAEQMVKKATSLGAQDAVADVYVDRNYEVRFSQNQIDISNKWREIAGELFVAVDRRIVVTEVKDFRNVDKIVANAVNIAKRSVENKEYGGIATGPFQYRPEPIDQKTVDLTDGGALVEAGIEAALKAGATETAGVLWRYDEEHYLHTSAGVSAMSRDASLYFSIRALKSLEESGHAVECATRFDDFHPERAGEKAGEIAAMVDKPEKAAPGKYDVVFDTMILGSLINEIGGSAGAFDVMAGLSPLKDKIGKSIASEAITLHDDGTADTIGAERFDDEGVPTQRNTIVDKGILKTYLHNTSTAKLFQTKTTANAGLIAPGSHALVLEPGDHSKEELFEQVKDGLYVTNTWYTRYQSHVTGDFSTIPRDGMFRIKDGKIAGAVKDLRLTDNIIGVWQRMEALSKDREQVMWWGEVGDATLAPLGLARQIGFTASSM
jgi:PmbA protein